MANNDGDLPLGELQVFLAVAQAGGFRDAARRSGLSPSTVSETVSRLEARLGLRLFHRSTRSVTVTEAGAALAERLAPALEEARAAVDRAMSYGERPRGVLRLNVPGAVMVDILPPVIERLLHRHPEVRVDITVDESLVDAIAAGCDAGVRYGEFMANDMIAVPLGPRRQQAALAASPDYLARHGTPTHPRELLSHACLRGRFPSGRSIEWEFEREGEVIRLDPVARLTVSTNATHAAIAAAEAGLGLVLVFRNWLEPAFAAGRLVPVLPDWWPGFEGPWIYYPSRRFVPLPLRAFLDTVADLRRETAG